MLKDGVDIQARNIESGHRHCCIDQLHDINWKINIHSGQMHHYLQAIYHAPYLR